MSATPSQIAANQANAQKSTGPTTAEGKQRSSLTALKTGLTGRTVLMPGEDAEAYQLHCERFEEQFPTCDVRRKGICPVLEMAPPPAPSSNTICCASAAPNSPKPSTTSLRPSAPL
jgi:hypothetical protein